LCPLVSERRNSTTRSAQDAELDDIIGIFDMLDVQGALNNVLFAAVRLDNLPKFGPEEINVAYVVERQARVESAINNVAATVQTLSSAQAAFGAVVDITTSSPVQSMVTDLQHKFDAFSSSVNARLDQLSTVYRTSLDAHNRPDLKITELNRIR
jgi:hypothetical protein